jgi:hypothetical protein
MTMAAGFFCNALFEDSLPHDFSNRIGPHSQSRHRNQILPPTPGHQTTAMFSWYDKLLPPFFAQLRTGVAPFD